jgi:hypothetical protein
MKKIDLMNIQINRILNIFKFWFYVEQTGRYVSVYVCMEHCCGIKLLSRVYTYVWNTKIIKNLKLYKSLQNLSTFYFWNNNS